MKKIKAVCLIEDNLARQIMSMVIENDLPEKEAAETMLSKIQ